ncbi:MAG: cellulase family glycosylhydrolase, partial [Candidatus Promineifilaceae bacterium]
MNRILVPIWMILLLSLLLGCDSERAADSSPTETAEPHLAEIKPSRTVEKATEPPQGNVVNLPLTRSEVSTTSDSPATTEVMLPASTNVPQPGELEKTPTPVPEPVDPTVTPTPTYPIYQGLPVNRENIGVQVHLHREDLDLLVAHLNTLDVGWVKVQVSWKIYQPGPGRFDDERFGELDRLIAAAVNNDIKVLLGVAKAPEWSRPTTELDGPPADHSHFESFMGILAARYQGRVAAYELWNESNLQREWNGYPLNAADLVSLVGAGARGVRAADPDAILISGAPAATGINDGVVAIDDRVYLQQMIDAGIAGIVDAIGAHPYGWANPPDSSFSNPDPAVPSHNDHPSFFFIDTLTDYRSILDQRDYQDKPLWVTEFGWGTFDGLNASPPEEVAFMVYVDETQQAAYTLRSYELASQWPGIGPLFLWNLNFAPRL